MGLCCISKLNQNAEIKTSLYFTRQQYIVTSLTSPWHAWCSDISVGSSRHHHPGQQLIQSSHMLPSLRRESNRRWSARAYSSYVQCSQDCHCLDQEDAINATAHLQISPAGNRASYQKLTKMLEQKACSILCQIPSNKTTNIITVYY